MPIQDHHEEPIDLVLGMLKERGFRWWVVRSGQWNGTCPVHDDRNASASLNESFDGSLGFKCHANKGCGTDDFVAAIGLPMSAMFPGRGRAHRRLDDGSDHHRDEARNRAQRLAESPVFLDHVQVQEGWSSDAMSALGIGLHSFARLSFPYRVPVRHGGAVLYVARSMRALTDAPAKAMEPGAKHGLLYRSDGLPDDVPIAIVEGGAAAVAALTCGIEPLAVSSASFVPPARWSPIVRGHAVYVFPDADESGRASAKRSAQWALDGGATSVAVVDLLPDHHHGEDLADVLREERRERTRERAQDAMNRAEVRTPQPNRGGRPAVAIALAEQYLRRALADGQWHSTSAVLAGIPEISTRTAKRARQNLRIERRKSGHRWEIRMPNP